MFESDFAKTDYIEKDNVVFHVWKKEAHFDDYRDPVKASLELLREHKDSIFIVDARNGFEDVKEDVEWGFEYFLPELKKTGCTICAPCAKGATLSPGFPWCRMRASR